MRNLTIEVWDASGNKKQLVELPADAPVNRVIAVLVDNEIYPAIKVQSFDGNVVHDLGLGIYRWADVIVGGLDNREARVAINLAAARAGKVWIDGAIERLEGVARVFDPATGPCYECTMGENDWKMLEARRSRALLSRDQMELGKVPTTPTTAAVIAGLQVQEAIKYLHGLETIAGRGFHFDGTYVNGIPVMRQVLKSGDQIVLGKTVLEFVLKEAN